MDKKALWSDSFLLICNKDPKGTRLEIIKERLDRIFVVLPSGFKNLWKVLYCGIKEATFGSLQTVPSFSPLTARGE